MNKNILLNFISKYHLGSNIETVIWNIEGSSLKTEFQSDDKTILGSVIVKDVDGLSIDQAKIGIYTTSVLVKLLNILNDEVEIKFLNIADKFASMDVSDKESEINFVLCDTEVVPRVPKLKKLPVFDIELGINRTFIDKFIKGKNALPDVESFTIISKSNQVQLIIGWSNINSDRVIVKTEYVKNVPDLKISFSAKYFKEILLSNKECKDTVLKISSRGLAQIQFKTDNFISNYFLVARDSQD